MNSRQLSTKERIVFLLIVAGMVAALVINPGVWLFVIMVGLVAVVVGWSIFSFVAASARRWRYRHDQMREQEEFEERAGRFQDPGPRHFG